MASDPSNPPLKAAIIPVTPLQQNCCLIWCTKTMRGAFTDPGGDLDRLKAAAAAARGDDREDPADPRPYRSLRLGRRSSPTSSACQIEGPHEDDRFWIARLEDDGRTYGITGKVFESDRWLVNGDR